MTSSKRRVPRLFIPRDLSADALALDQQEAHYLGHVLRLERGDDLVVFNGRGSERQASVVTLQRRGAELALRAVREPLPESPLDLTLLQALPKADAMDLIVQKGTELGVRTIIPVYSEFSVVKLDAERGERRAEHWRRVAQSACEQCGRHTPPSIAAAAPLLAALESLPTATARYALDLDGPSSLGTQPPTTAAVLAVGPEGGFAAADWRRLDNNGFERIALGRRVLRAETAAIAICALAQARWGDL